MQTLIHRWLNFWVGPQSPVNLAAGRILFFGALFLLYLPQDFAAWATVSDVFWMPIYLFDALNLPVLSEPVLNVVQSVWKAALLLSCLGLFTRISTATAFVLGFYLLALPHNFAKVYHYDAVLVFALGILMASRCGDAISLDRWRARRKSGTNVDSIVGPSGEYRWPIRAIWLVLALVFFASGVAKLRYGGLAWITSDNMAFILIRQQYGLTPLVNWGVYLAQSPWLYRPLALATVVLETGYPLAMVSRRARWVFVPGMVATQIGIRVLMGPSFEQFIICNLFWVPWDRVLALLPALIGSRSRQMLDSQLRMVDE